jgi:ATP-binding cassette subfamily B protein
MAWNSRNIRNIAQALRLVWRSSPQMAQAICVLLIIQGVLPAATLYLVKLVVDAVAAGMATQDRTGGIRHAAALILAAGIIGLLTAVVSALVKLVQSAQALAVTDHMYDVLHAKCANVDLASFEDCRYYDLLRRAQQEAPFRPTQIVNNLAQVGRSGIALATLAGMLLSLNWGIALLLFLSPLPGALLCARSSRRLYQWESRQTPIDRQAWYFSWLLTDQTTAKEIRLYGLGPLFLGRFRDLRSRLRRERLAIGKQTAIGDLVTSGSAGLATYFAYGYMAYRTLLGLNTLGDLVLYYQVFQRGQAFLLEFLGSLSGLYESSLYLTSLDDFLALERHVAEPTAPLPVARPMRTGILFEGVTFRYDAGSRNVLEDITLAVRPGQIVALVGSNGAGKTTLIKLLCRLYDPTGGRVLLDGVDLRELSTSALRQEISVVLQDFVRYQMTARENIWLGNIALAKENAGILTAARCSGAHSVIAGMKAGYETVLGNWFEGGEELSGGEWQKIALARALSRDSQIVVLDEPTSAMDPQAEFEFFQQFRHAVKDRAVILISHRFSTVRMADHIYVLGDGRITESGTHDELVARGQTYAELFKSQACLYHGLPLGRPRGKSGRNVVTQRLPDLVDRT